MDAYLDIETSFDKDITVVGILKLDVFKQFVGSQISASAIKNFMNGVRSVYTYNGSRFDIPVIKKNLGLDLCAEFECKDLMHNCWKNDLFGGLKNVEYQLGIARRLKDVNGFKAMQLWAEYVKNNNEDALLKLLLYNKEDVYSIVQLHKKLRGLDVARNQLAGV